MKILIYHTHKVSYHVSIFNEINKIFKNTQIEINFFLKKRLKDLKQNNWEQIEKKFNKFFKINFDINYSKNIFFKSKKDNFFNNIDLTLIIELITKKYDYIYFQGYDSLNLFIILMISKIKRTKVIWRGEFYEKENKFIRKHFKNYYITFFLKNCNFILYSTLKSKEYIQKLTVKKKILPMYSSANGFYRKINQQVKNKFIEILFVGKFNERKNIFQAIKEINLSKYKNKINLNLCGDGELEKQIKNYCLSNNINFKIYKKAEPDTLLKLYNKCSFLIHLSKYDPSPKVCNEAMNCNLPMIISNQIGISKDLKEYNKSICIITNINNNLTKSLNFICENYKKMKNNYKKVDITRFTPQQNAKIIAKIVGVVSK